jgi:hypothetical protein
MRRSKPALFLAAIIVSIVIFTTTKIKGQSMFEPTLDFPKSEFELGEAIVFKVGRQTSALVNPTTLMEAACSLSLEQPNGTKTVVKTIQGLEIYDGPSLGQSLGYNELLNDLTTLSLGVYRIGHTCGNQAVVREIAIKPARLVEQLSLDPIFPERIDPSGNNPIIVRIRARNLGVTTIRVSKTAVDQPIAVLAIPSGPAIYRMALQLPLRPQTNQNTQMANLEPEAAYMPDLTFENPLIRALSRYRQGKIDRFQISLVFVISITSDGNPIGADGLYRFTACYDAAGQKLTTPCTPFSLKGYFP